MVVAVAVQERVDKARGTQSGERSGAKEEHGGEPFGVRQGELHGDRSPE